MFGKSQRVEWENFTQQGKEEGSDGERSESLVNIMENLNHMSLGVAVSPHSSLAFPIVAPRQNTL